MRRVDRQLAAARWARWPRRLRRRSPPRRVRSARPPARRASSRRAPCGRGGRGRGRSRRARSPPALSAWSALKTSISTWPSTSSRVANIIWLPLLVRIFLHSVTMPPTVTQEPSGLLREVGERAVDPGAQRLAHFGERVRGEVGAERLLLHRQQLGALELGGRDRRAVLGRLAGARLRRLALAEVEDRALAELRVLLRLLAGRLRRRQRLEHPLAGGPGRVERAALDQAFDRAFVDRAGVDPLAEVPDRGDRRCPRGRAGSPRPPRGRRS